MNLICAHCYALPSVRVENTQAEMAVCSCKPFYPLPGAALLHDAYPRCMYCGAEVDPGKHYQAWYARAA